MRWVWVYGLAALVAALVSSPVRARQAAGTPGEDLPEGDGKQILLAACITCHGLNEVTKFRGYYDRAQWRDVVVTMVEYGAPVEPPQVEVLTDYLMRNLGKRPAEASR